MRSFFRLVAFIAATVLVSSCKKTSSACFTMSSKTVNVGQAVVFVSCSECEKCTKRNSLDNYQWDFGDGSTGTGVTVAHSYSNPGQYWKKIQNKVQYKRLHGKIARKVFQLQQ